MKELIQELEAEQMHKDRLDFGPGDTVKVYSKIKEGDKERLSAFEGIVLKRQNGSSRETFTVRKLVQGIGVERTYPIHSPRIERIKVVRKGKVSRAKLYYLRGRIGGAATRVEEELSK